MPVLVVFTILDTLPVLAVVNMLHNQDCVWQEHGELEDRKTSGWGLLHRLDREYLDNWATSSLCSWRVLPLMSSMAMIAWMRGISI